MLIGVLQPHGVWVFSIAIAPAPDFFHYSLGLLEPALPQSLVHICVRLSRDLFGVITTPCLLLSVLLPP